MKNAKIRRQITMVTLVLALGAAIYLNWEYAKNDTALMQDTSLVSTQGEEVLLETNENMANIEQKTEILPDEAGANTQDMLTEEKGNKNYGDAQLVSTNVNTKDDYFKKAALTRTKSRDEALDKLQKSLKNSKLTKAEKEVITSDLTKILTGITAEGDIENMILAKGFENCIVNISNEKVNVAVNASANALEAEKIAQIRDIVLSKFETEAKNITIVEVK
ncbi:MAG: SpoIIIAH-like family protein [Oscillospiraceae bacterium]